MEAIQIVIEIRDKRLSVILERDLFTLHIDTGRNINVVRVEGKQGLEVITISHLPCEKLNVVNWLNNELRKLQEIDNNHDN